MSESATSESHTDRVTSGRPDPGRVRSYRAGIVLVCAVTLYFLWVRPLNSPWHPYIAGDGLGYYSYLPATFIYHDRDYRFRWFNAAHDSNYVYSTFENPEDNILVRYGDRKINKYYQGLSFVWMPFFLAAHVVAKLTGIPADGFSPPYQFFIGLASLLTLLTGLLFLRKLILRLMMNVVPGRHTTKYMGDDLVATLVSAAIFFGTHLCNYGVFANTLSHSYSFTFLVLYLYYLVKYEESGNDRHVVAAALFFVIGMTIRPLNALTIFLAPAFVKKLTMLQPHRWRSREILLSLLIVASVTWTLFINYRQTGSFFAYNYTDEKFDFTHPRFVDALISYHQGLFTYVPLVLISLFGIFYLRDRKRWILPLFFLAMLFLYSCWWYWPITKRAMVDFYALPAVMLGALLAGIRRKALVIALIFVCVCYHQFKSYQFRNGILDENATYGDVFWRHFFRTTKANIYPIAPETILKEQSQDIALKDRFGAKVSEYEGRETFCLDPSDYIATFAECSLPEFFTEAGYRKVRFSFDCCFEQGVKSMHVFIQFYGRDGKLIREVPFYLNEADIADRRWDRKEFGHEIADEEGLSNGQVSHVNFTIWNVEGKRRIWIAAPKVEFVLTDRSFETIR
jgi:hypothetical protein